MDAFYKIGLGFHSDSFISLHQTTRPLCNGRCATNKYFQIIGSIHDIESYTCIDNTSSLNAQVFFCHFGHLAIIFGIGATEVFHIGWNGDFSCSLKNPIAAIPIAHGIGDPHFGNPISEAYSSGNSYYRFILSFSGIYNWLYTVGFNTVSSIYNFVITYEFLGVTLIRIGNLHLIYSCQFTQWVALNNAFSNGFLLSTGVSLLVKKLALHIKVHPIFIWPCKLFVVYFDCLCLTFISSWSSILAALLSGGWSAHLVHLAHNNLASSSYPFYTGDWPSYSRILTFLGGLKSNRASLYITDIAHHHFALGLLFLWQHTLTSSLYKAPMHLSLFTGNSSLHLHLSLALWLGGGSIAGVGTSLTSLTPYPYLSYDYLTTTALDLHHSSIALFLMIGSFAHGGIFFIREIRLNINSTKDLIGRILAHKAAIISHLT